MSRRHDDVHYPMQGRGKRATRPRHSYPTPRAVLVPDYPPGWPRCSCGDYALDGHLTCGRIECDESAARVERVRDWMRRGKAAQEAVDRILGKERPK